MALIEAAVALAVIAGLPWFERLPGVFLAGYRAGIFDTFAVSQIFLFGLAGSLVIVPTLLLGVVFPAPGGRETVRQVFDLSFAPPE